MPDRAPTFRDAGGRELRRFVREELLRADLLNSRLPAGRADAVIEEVAQLLLDAAEAEQVELDTPQRLR